MVSDNGAKTSAPDISTQVATAVLSRPGVLALSPGRDVVPVLHLSSAVEDPVAVRVTVAGADGSSLLDTTVTVPGLADTVLKLPKAGNVLVGVEPAGPGSLHASVAVRANLDGFTGVSSLAILSGAAAATLPPIRQDPRVGS